jgi:hypothetical protein
MLPVGRGEVVDPDEKRRSGQGKELVDQSGVEPPTSPVRVPMSHTRSRLFLRAGLCDPSWVT